MKQFRIESGCGGYYVVCNGSSILNKSPRREAQAVADILEELVAARGVSIVATDAHQILITLRALGYTG